MFTNSDFSAVAFVAQAISAGDLKKEQNGHFLVASWGKMYKLIIITNCHALQARLQHLVK
jgi:hypothetical protein